MTYESAEVNGMPTLLRDDEPVAYLDGGTLRVSPMFAEQALAVLTRVYAPDEATIERLAPAVHDAYLETCDQLCWSVKPENAVPYAELSDDSQELDRASVRAVLAALAAAPGPTDDEAVTP